MPIVQAVTIAGQYPQNCRWLVPTIENLREGQSFQIVFKTKDKNIAAGMSKIRSNNIQIEKDNSGWSMILSMVVFEVRHMLEPKFESENDEEEDGEESVAIETLALIKPKDRNVENVLLIIRDPESVDPRFVELMKQETQVR